MAHSLYAPLLMASITASSLLSGFLITFSYVGIPGLLAVPNLSERDLLSVWKQLYFRGFHLSPPLSIFSGSCCFLNAYLTHTQGAQQGSGTNIVSRLLVAGSLMGGVVPYTILMVAPGNKKMMARFRQLTGPDAKAGGPEDTARMAESRGRVQRWGVLNYGRALIPLAGALVAWTV